MTDEIDLASFVAQHAPYAKKYAHIEAFDENTREAVQELKVMARSYGPLTEARLTPPILWVRVPTCDDATVKSMRGMCKLARARCRSDSIN